METTPHRSEQNYTEIVSDLRRITGGTAVTSVTARAADVIEALVEERDELKREMHARELHHFESEKLPIDAGIDPDAAVATPQDTEWEYGWRCFFDNGEEYEWLACASREEAEYQAAEYQIEEDATHPAGAGHLTYSVWRRRTAKAGPWEPLPGEAADA